MSVSVSESVAAPLRASSSFRPSASAASSSARREKTAVAWSTFGVESRDNDRRGSGDGFAGPGAGIGGSFPGVDSVDDSYRFDLSGDVPATDASSRAPPVSGARAQPNRETRRPDTSHPRHHRAAPVSEPCTSVLCAGLTPAVDENDIPIGSTTFRSRTLDR